MSLAGEVSLRWRGWIRSVALAVLLLCGLITTTDRVQGQVAGDNVNMVSGTEWPGGDPFLQRQNEPSIAVSSRNPLHLLAGANDYRTVDLPGLPDDDLATGDAWLGLFKSFDGGATWQSTLLPGYQQDLSPEGLASPLTGTAAADPVVRAGTHGLFYYLGITFDRDMDSSQIFVARFIDLNNKENGDITLGSDPIKYTGEFVANTGTSGQFMDKPWMFVGKPDTGAEMVELPTDPPQTVPCGPVFIAFAKFTGSNSSKIEITTSLDCGETWGHPKKVSQTNTLNQGTAGAIDPTTGDIYVAWRRFQNPNDSHAIMLAKSTNDGQTWTSAQEVATIVPFDQGISATTFRTQSLPTMAISVDSLGQSRIHLAWADRGAPGGDARIVITTSEDGGSSWSTPTPVDDAPIVDDFGSSFSQGHQLMPAMTYSAGKLMVLYYESRLDHTVGLFYPNDPFVPDSQGRFYLEERDPRGELPSNPGLVFTPFIDDFGLTLRRHTIDLRVSQSDPGPSLSFNSAMVSRYPFGTRGDEEGTVEVLPQLQVNPPNFPLFSQGLLAFIGDYIDIQGQMFLPPETPGGEWQYNLAASSGAVHHATWTSNQDVRPPPDGDWTNYTPVGGGGPSLYNPEVTTPPCEPGREGMRNQNIYTSRITQGLLVSSPQNAKPLSETLTRALVVTAQNFTDENRAFRLTIANQPVGGKASWLQIHGPTDPDPLTELELEIGTLSGIARTVFATSSNPTERIRIEVEEITGLGGSIVPDGLSGFVVFNADPTAPALTNPDGVTDPGQDISIIEVYAPNVTNPNVTNPNVTNPNVTNPNVTNPNVTNPNVTNPNVTNPDVADPNVTNPNVTNPNVTNPNVTNPNVTNPNVTNTAVSDATYTVTNNGNTSTSFRVKLTGEQPDSDVQLLVTKTVTNPIGLNCELQEEQNSVVLANIRNPVFEDASSFDPNIPDPSLSNATFALRPGETALVTLRGEFETVVMQDVVAQSAPVIIPHPSGAAASPLLITTSELPEATLGEPYSATLEVLGSGPEGTGLAWTVVEGMLPNDLNLDALTGEITGVPVEAGSFEVTIEVTDSASPPGMSRTTLTLFVNQIASTTSISSSDNPSVFGQEITVTASVTPSSSAGPEANGIVTFAEGETTLATVSLSAGSASFTTADLGVGSHTITATHEGDSNYFPSVSEPLTQTVDLADTTVDVESSAASPVLGEPVTLTATVSAVAPGAGTPAGSVTFLDGAAPLGTVVLVDGGASVTVATLGVGEHSITVVYDGDARFNGSTSDPFVQAVGPAGSTTVVATNANPSFYGQPVTFTATVTGATTLADPGGNVTFFDGSSTLGTAPLVGGNASLTTAALSIGTHAIRAVYGGDANFTGSGSTDLAQIVDLAGTTTGLASSANPSVFGQSVTFTATVEVVGPGAGSPSGSVTFMDGSTPLGTVDLVDGNASLTTAALEVSSSAGGGGGRSASSSSERAARSPSALGLPGANRAGRQPRDVSTPSNSRSTTAGAPAHALTAIYSGDATFAGSTSTVLQQEVHPATTSTEISSSVNPSIFGQGVTFTATVDVIAPGEGAPTGTVTFFDDAATLGTSTLSGGNASLSTSALTGGEHSISAAYNGDGSFVSSTSAALTQSVEPATTTTSLASDANPAIYGAPVTFTATVAVVAPGAGTPLGTVTFNDGGTPIGSAAIVSGSASLTTSVLSPGDHSITAAYAGGVNFAGSASVVLVQSVQQVTTTTTVSSDVNPSSLRQPVVLTAIVTSAGGTPTGSVTFKDGTRILGTAELAAGQASLTTSAIAAGNRSITAEYPGDGLFEPSASDALIQSVVYQFEGFFSPLSTAGTISDPSDSGGENLGSAVPIKWRLSDFEGTFIVKRRAAKSLSASFNPDCSGLPEGPAVQLFSPVSGAPGGSTLRFDRGNGRFDFNFDTTAVQEIGPGCYSIILELDDDSEPRSTIINLQ